MKAQAGKKSRDWAGWSDNLSGRVVLAKNFEFGSFVIIHFGLFRVGLNFGPGSISSQTQPDSITKRGAWDGMNLPFFCRQ